MKDEVELADTLKAFVQRLDKDLYKVKDAQLTLWAVHAEHKVQGGVVPIDQFVVRATYEAANKKNRYKLFSSYFS